MLLKNHIAYRFLTDEYLTFEILQHMHPEEYQLLALDQKDQEINNIIKLDSIASTYDLINKEDQKAYYLTETVTDLLYLLKVKRLESNSYDWSVFKNIKECKKTFIFPNMKNVQHMLRIKVIGDHISFCYITYTPYKDIKYRGETHWVIFYVNRVTYEQCEHSSSPDVLDIDELVYRLMCFTFLVDNEEVIIKSGHRHGTMRTGKIINEFKFPLTIINSRWNQTIHRTDGFTVKGHFAIRWSGIGKSIAKVVFIEPFKKEGYTRKSGKELEKSL